MPSILPQIPKMGREEGATTGNKDAPSLLPSLTRSDLQTAQKKGYPFVYQMPIACPFTPIGFSILGSTPRFR